MIELNRTDPSVRASQKLLDGSKGADLSTILTLQSNLVASLHLALTMPIDEEHYPYFDQLWIASRLTDTDESNRWRRLGFRTESPQYEFGQAGLLGLKALKRYAEDSQNEFAQVRTDCREPFRSLRSTRGSTNLDVARRPSPTKLPVPKRAAAPSRPSQT